MRQALVILILLGTSLPVSFAQSQVTVDSLELALKNAQADTLRLQLMLELSRHHSNRDFDQAASLAQQVIDLAKAKQYVGYELKAERLLAGIMMQNQERTRYTMAIIALAGGLLIAVMLLIIIRSRSRQIELKQRYLAQDIEIKNKELTTSVMYLVRKNELINDVAERLLQFKKSIVGENQNTINEIVTELQREADNDSWKEFDVRFNQVHSDFFDTLRKRHPDLSTAEEKLCAFLKLNMSSSEIAAITKQAVKSVEASRAGLRKKLNLPDTTSDLVAHLNNLSARR